VSYEELCRLFFKSHEPSLGATKRQYMSAIFAHTDEQFETAQNILLTVKQSKPHASTKVEMATDFYEGEIYHQKWLLQGKSDWFQRLGVCDARELIEGQPASRLNAYVAGYVTNDEMRAYVNGWSKAGLVSDEALERLSFDLN
jgi:hypothetical protein